MLHPQYTFKLWLQNRMFEMPKIRETIVAVSKKVADELLINNEYNVTSNVSEETFGSFIDYWKNQEKIPTVNSFNFIEYYQLSQEFGMLSQIITTKFNDPLTKLSILIDKNNLYIDKSDIESDISHNLDLYLNNYSDQMRQIPIQSLYNIFYSNKTLHDHAKIYHFITSAIDEQNKSNFIILFQCIDGQKLYLQSPELFSDLISRYGDYRLSISKLDL